MGASAWHGLVGTPGYAAGAAGTVVVPVGAVVIAIIAHATSAGSFTLFGGASVPVPAGSQISLDFKHALFQSQGAGGSIVFTGTDSYLVHYVRQGHAT
jgi:hypothetical protein